MSKPKFNISCVAENNNAVVRIDGYISSWNNHSAGFKEKLDSLIANGIKDVIVYINSGGGDCFEANEIVNELLRFTGSKTAKIGALCASAATYIASKCDTVQAAENTSYMIHKPSGYCGGTAEEIKSYVKLVENMEAEYAKTYAKKTGLTEARIKELWVTDYWMSAEEGKKLGFINSIEGQAEITQDDVEATTAYKNAPRLIASANQSQTQNNIIMKQLIITAFALAATLSDAEVMAHLENIKAKAAKADDLQAKLNAAEASAIKVKIDAVISDAEAKKKITAAQREFWEKALATDFEGAKATLESMPGVTKLSAETKEEGNKEDRSKWTYADYQEKNPQALAALAKDDEPTFNKLFEAHYGKSK